MQHVNEQLIIRQKQHRDEEWAVLHITAIPNPTILEAIIRHIHHVHLENAYIQKYKEINDAETAS